MGMVQVSTELTTRRKNNGFMGNFKHSCNFTAVLIFYKFLGECNPCTERTEAEKVTSNDQNKQTYILSQINTKTLFFCNNCVTIGGVLAHKNAKLYFYILFTSFVRYYTL